MTIHAPPTTLAAFLLARADEDEAVALAATCAEWRAVLYSDHPEVDFAKIEGPANPCDRYQDCESEHREQVALLYGDDRESSAAHIARHDPARVLAEVAALRAVVALREAGSPGCSTSCIHPPFVDDTLRALAQPFADHPEFDPGWRA